MHLKMDITVKIKLFLLVLAFIFLTIVNGDKNKSFSTQTIENFNSSSNSANDNSNRHKLVFAVLLPSETLEISGSDGIYQKVLPAIELGVSRIQHPGFLKEKFDVTIVFRNTFCSSVYGPIGFYEIYSSLTINAVFGLTCDYVLAPIARYAGVWEIPVLTTSGFPGPFDAKQMHYPTMTRIMGGSTELGVAVKGIMNLFNWTITGFIYQNSDDKKVQGNSNCYHITGGIHNAIKGENPEEFKADPNTNTIDALNSTMILKRIKSKARIIIMCANPQSIRQIMLSAEELNMIDSGEYVFFNIELYSSISQTTTQPWYDKNDTPENNERARKAYTALLTVTAKQPDDENYIEFSNKVKEIARTKYNYTFERDEPVSTFVTAFYDAVLLYAFALNDSITEDPSVLTKPINGTDMVHRMWNRSFNGITGNVTIDTNGDRISAYSLLDMNPETGKFEIVAHYFYNHLEYVQGKSIHWAGGRIDPPPDKPICGFDGSLCPDNSLPGYAILSLVLGFTVVIMAIISILGYRHYKSEAEINSMTWRINWNEIMPCDPNAKYRGSMHSLAKRGSQITLYSEDLGSLSGDRQIYIPVGFYRGCKVAIKKIDESNINLNRSLMLELKKMKDIQHDHLVKFYGACLDPPKCCILTEYCPKGSLQDILENDQINLDWMFKLSLMHDIVRGMHFLHQSDIKAHGTLKSSNCVVDSRFVLKITDFGLHRLRKSNDEDDVENCNSHAYWKKFLWTAPEILRLENPPLEATQKGDVYSFGIIVHEITTRQGPFYSGADCFKSPKEIVELVKNYSNNQSVPFRPQIDDMTYDDINNIMVKCWAEDPCERPDFGYLKTTIRKINKDNETGNIVDNLLQRMEQYANNLEGLVEERTHDYMEEKKKCEKLLYQLLPVSVAAQLIAGQPVIAETYDQVTIYFSDIVGFTAISAESTPMQVVSFLNDLYTCFDSIVENFDVYKVETIGDAYMVVSGLPVRNGNLHAREIARLALALLDAVRKFTIHHRPNDQLKLRIGLHSGPCVAGVVGHKMPRYCLFGDTVNTASRMESNGEALKIHISHSTKEYLDQFNTFDVKERGFVKMKGKGEMLTYWLEGERYQSDADDTTAILLESDKQTSYLNYDDFKTDVNLSCNDKESSCDVTIDDRPEESENSNPPNIVPNNSCSSTSSCSNNNAITNHNDITKHNCSNINFNSMVKANNLKNLKTKCNISDENVKDVKQPLLAKINS